MKVNGKTISSMASEQNRGTTIRSSLPATLWRARRPEKANSNLKVATTKAISLMVNSMESAGTTSRTPAGFMKAISNSIIWRAKEK
jgi:hypothetical protein